MIENTYTGFLNLDHRTDRLERMRLELNRVNLTAFRHRGKLPHEYDLNDPKVQVMKNRTPGAIGCHFGQVGIIQEAQRQGKNAMVLEDDVHFCEDFYARLLLIDNFCENNEWDIFWLGASFHVNPPFWHRVGQSGMNPDCSAQLGYDAKRTANPRIMQTFGAYITFAYIVNLKSIDKVLALLNQHLHTSIGIDWLMIKLQPQLKTFAFVPGCVMQIDNMSDIGTGMTMWSGQLKNGPYVFQELMTDFDPKTFDWHEAN